MRNSSGGLGNEEPAISFTIEKLTSSCRSRNVLLLWEMINLGHYKVSSCSLIGRSVILKVPLFHST